MDNTSKPLTLKTLADMRSAVQKNHMVTQIGLKASEMKQRLEVRNLITNLCEVGIGHGISVDLVSALRLIIGKGIDVQVCYKSPKDEHWTDIPGVSSLLVSTVPGVFIPQDGVFSATIEMYAILTYERFLLPGNPDLVADTVMLQAPEMLEGSETFINYPRVSTARYDGGCLRPVDSLESLVTSAISLNYSVEYNKLNRLSFDLRNVQIAVIED